ncbi:MAG: tetratricopeptide repeat protein [Bacteroidales bacterium]
MTDSLLLKSNVAGSPEEQIETFLFLSEQLIDNEPLQSYGYTKNALELAVMYELNDQRIKAFNSLAEVNFRLSKFEEAMESAIKAREASEKENNKIEYIHAILNMGNIYTSLGNYEKGSAYLYECLKRSEDIQEVKFLARILNSIGIIYHNQQNYEKSRDYYLRALDESKKWATLKELPEDLITWVQYTAFVENMIKPGNTSWNH